MRCGGNTACVEVRCGDAVLILDAGTGIRLLGHKLKQEGVRSVNLLISHPHIDHMAGFPFFAPAYDAAVEIRIHMPPRGVTRSSEPFDRLMEAPHFPVLFRNLPARIHFSRLGASESIGPVQIQTHPLNHPGGNTAFRIEYKGKTMVYLTDHEPYGRLNGHDPHAPGKDRAVNDFTRGADLLIRECQYTIQEYELHRGWGHGTFDDAMEGALAAGVRRLVLFHHDPDHDDDFLEAQLNRLRARPDRGTLEVHLAREGEAFHLIESESEAA